jgi:hypothetical protein
MIKINHPVQLMVRASCSHLRVSQGDCGAGHAMAHSRIHSRVSGAVRKIRALLVGHNPDNVQSAIDEMFTQFADYYTAIEIGGRLADLPSFMHGVSEDTITSDWRQPQDVQVDYTPIRAISNPNSDDLFALFSKNGTKTDSLVPTDIAGRLFNATFPEFVNQVLSVQRVLVTQEQGPSEHYFEIVSFTTRSGLFLSDVGAQDAWSKCRVALNPGRTILIESV